MKWVLGVLAAIAASVVGWLIIQALTPRADVRYALSEPLRIARDGQSEDWQQLEVRNVGKRTAKEVQVRVAAQLSQYSVEPHSQAASLKQFSKDNVMDLEYDSLPPDASFTVKMASSGGRILPADLEVRHAEGRGLSAFVESGRISKLLLLGSTPLIWLAFFAFFIREGLVSGLKYKGKWEGPYGLLGKRKPFYVTSEGWRSLREQALEDAFWGDTAEDPTATRAWALLNDIKPKAVTNFEWVQLVRRATERVSEKMLARVGRMWWYTDEGAVRATLALGKPEQFQEHEWDKLKEEVSRRYVACQPSVAFRSMETAAYPKRLRETKPPGVLQEHWDAYRQTLADTYFNRLLRSMGIGDSAPGFLDRQDLSVLPNEDVAKLREDAYARARTSLLDLTDATGANKFLSAEKPDWMNQDEYENLRARARKTVELDAEEKKVAEKSADLLDREQHFCERVLDMDRVVEKAEKHLQLINDLLSDPDSIDRIEDYKGCFTPGTLENLRRVANLLKQAKP